MTKKKPVHYVTLGPRDGAEIACGRVKRRFAEVVTTEDVRKVTCRYCRADLERGQRAARTEATR